MRSWCISLFPVSILLFSFSSPSLASIPASGSFTAIQKCPLYQSKRNKTNPGNLYSSSSNHYKVKEVDQVNPEWVRVDSENRSVQEPYRWVKTQCGHIKELQLRPNKIRPQSCHTHGQYDSNVLALSWQPTFCSTHADKPECNAPQPGNTLGHFTLHGLWPNKQECDIDYNFCGKVKRKEKSFCDYPKLQLSDQIRTQLGEVMPSAAYGSCLQRHEWWKHGTCRDESPDNYFQVSINLTNQFNGSEFVSNFIVSHIGTRVSRTAFYRAFNSSFGPGSSNRLGLYCSDGKLAEIRLSLPKDISLTNSLNTLLSHGKEIKESSCGTYFTIPNSQ